MEHIYRMELEEIKSAAEQLLYLHSEGSHEYRLHIDGDKLTTCMNKLGGMVDAIKDEKGD